MMKKKRDQQKNLELITKHFRSWLTFSLFLPAASAAAAVSTICDISSLFFGISFGGVTKSLFNQMIIDFLLLRKIHLSFKSVCRKCADDRLFYTVQMRFLMQKTTVRNYHYDESSKPIKLRQKKNYLDIIKCESKNAVRDFSYLNCSLECVYTYGRLSHSIDTRIWTLTHQFSLSVLRI